MNKFYLTTPLYYVNSKPHIGHAYTQIAADSLARWNRLTGKDVHFLTGTDEHGQKIDKAAKEAGVAPKEFTDTISQTFRDLWKTLDISYDDFIRTTEKRHMDAVQKVWEKIRTTEVLVDGKPEKALYRHTYDGFYCVPDETFVTESMLDPNAPTLCPQCRRPLEKMKEDTYFLRISAYQDRLMDDIRTGRFRVLPESRRNEVMGFLEHNKLSDLSISRPKSRLSWGIPVPFDTEHVTYVWFDALINYISACGYPDAQKMSEWWPADVHIIGKDIIRHHAVIWPVLLYALNLELPKMVFAHGWWVQGGQKMSKSLGNVTDPRDIVARYGVDPFRYFLLREAPFGEDGTFSEEGLILRYNTDLANDLGNLLHRSLSMCEKYFGGIVPDFPVVPQGSTIVGEATALKARAEVLFDRVDDALKKLAFSQALQEIWSVVEGANKFVETSAPWTLAKQKKDEDLKLVIITLLDSLKTIAQALWPFLPSTSEGLWRQLGITSRLDRLSDVSGPLHSMHGVKIQKGQPLFPRIETEKK